MTRVWRPISTALAGLCMAAMCAYPQATTSAQPGTINFVEGHASVNGTAVGQNQIGHLNLDANQALETDANSKAEVLLTPGVFLRLGNNSQVKMISPSLTNTRVDVTRGEALIDVARLFKDNNVQIGNKGSTTRLLKSGLYRFNAETGQVAVLDGKATVFEGDNHVELKKGRQVTIGSGALRAEKFDTKSKDDLYAWSNLRSEYAAEASYATAKNIIVNNYGGWGAGVGSGWFWNPWYSSWAFVPAAGYFYDPFGWGFYSPRTVYYAPAYYSPGRYRAVPVNGVMSRGSGVGIAARPWVASGMHPSGAARATGAASWHAGGRR